MSARSALRHTIVVGALALAILGCQPAPAPVRPVPERRDTSRTTVREVPRERPDGPLTAAERDSIIAESAARRAVWRQRQITNYRIRVAVGCFCPWPSAPRLLEVREGKAVALLDTLGRAAGPLVEPWAPYTVEGMFDLLEQSVRRSDMVSVRYDARFGYPREIRGVGKLGLPDNWFWVTATDLRPRR